MSPFVVERRPDIVPCRLRANYTLTPYSPAHRSPHTARHSARQQGSAAPTTERRCQLQWQQQQVGQAAWPRIRQGVFRDFIPYSRSTVVDCCPRPLAAAV
jgi:hypothetical protein